MIAMFTCRGPLAAQDTGQHRHALLGESIRKIPAKALFGNAIRFEFTFLNAEGEAKITDYGASMLLRFRESDVPLSK